MRDDKIIIENNQIKASDYSQNENKNNNYEAINNFYNWLKGEYHPDCLCKTFKSPKLTAQMAFRIIYYLQEVMCVLPDNIEKCSHCGDLFDSENEGDNKKGHHCGGCSDNKYYFGVYDRKWESKPVAPTTPINPNGEVRRDEV